VKSIRTLKAGALGLALSLALGGCAVDSLDDTLGPGIEDIAFAPSLGIDLDDFNPTGVGVYFRDDIEGEGTQVFPGRTVTVITTGWLANGTEFQPQIEIEGQVAGSGAFIPGFDAGILNMREGGIRWLIIPPELGYGQAGNPGAGIPGNSWLVFEIEMTEVIAPGG